MARRRIIIPARFIRIDKGTNTVSVRNPRTGKFRGRRRVSSGADQTHVRRTTQSYDFNNDGRIGPNERGGLIFGRTTSTRASSRAKGHVRRI